MRKFTGIVHVCSLPEEQDILHHFFPGKSRWTKFRRRIRRSFTISSQNSLAVRYFKSYRAIDRERTRHLQSHFYVIHPYSIFKQRWDRFMLIVYLFAFWFIPYYASYIHISPRKRNYLLSMIADFSLCITFLIDIVINIFAGYVQSIDRQNYVVLHPGKIFVNYLTGFFFFDLLTSLPIDHVSCSINANIYPIYFLPELRLLKYVRFITFRKSFYQTTEQFGLKFVPGQILYWLISFVTFIHLLGCIHNWLSLMSLATGMEDIPWIIEKKVYLASLGYNYFINFTIATYAILNLDFMFEPSDSRIEQMFAVVVGFIGNLWIAAAIAKCIQWAHIIFAAAKKYEDLEMQLRAFMHYRKLPYFLQERIKKYYEFRFQKTYFQEASILPLLSPSLKEDILMHSCRRMVQNVSFFHGIPASMLVRVVVCLRPEIFLVNDVIIKAGTHGNCMYFVTSGTVAVYSSSGKEICHLEDGAHLGEVALVIEEAIRVTSVVAVENCELQRLDRHDFRRVVAPYPDLAMRIERIAEDRLEKSVAFDEFHRRTLSKRAASNIKEY